MVIDIKANSVPTFNELVKFINEMPNIDEEAVELVRKRDSNLLKPSGSLGLLEELVEWVSGWQGSYPPRIDNLSLSIFVSNHGTATNHRISPFPTSVTEALVKSFRAEHAVVNQICKTHNIGLQVFDLAIEVPTNDITKEPAMLENDCITTILFGREALSSNPDILCLGDAGIGNTTIASAICSALYGEDVEEWVGSGTGADQEMIEKKIEVIKKSLITHKNREPFQILRCFGGREFAAIAGAIIAARFERVPVILDGFPVCAAAAILYEISPSSIDHCYVGHRSAELGHSKLLEKINKTPLIDFKMRLGEGSGAAMAMPIIMSAINIHNNTSTFEEADVPN
jgi:nicotinate-nucleotide--dimethylbenzimidazole phosphoribosyltransferase